MKGSLVPLLLVLAVPVAPGCESGGGRLSKAIKQRGQQGRLEKNEKKAEGLREWRGDQPDCRPRHPGSSCLKGCDQGYGSGCDQGI